MLSEPFNGSIPCGHTTKNYRFFVTKCNSAKQESPVWTNFVQSLTILSRTTNKTVRLRMVGDSVTFSQTVVFDVAKWHFVTEWISTIFELSLEFLAFVPPPKSQRRCRRYFCCWLTVTIQSRCPKPWYRSLSTTLLHTINRKFPQELGLFLCCEN